MANQPPTGRPWFRLASQVLRQSTPPPQPVQPPQGPPIRQLVTQPSAVLPPQPQTPPAQPPPPPPPSPLPKPSVTPSQGESKETAPPSTEQPKQPSSPLPPLKPIKTSPSPPPESSKVKSPSPTPSPSPKYDSGDRTLKPSPEPEVKTIPEAQPKRTITNGKGEAHKNARKSEPKLGTSQADTRVPPPSPKKEAKKKDEGDMRMITIAGDNIGAYMDLAPSYSLHSRKQQQQQQKQKSNGSLPKQGQESDSATEDGKSSDKNGARDAAAAAAAAKAKPMTSLVNSNVQSVNNSIIFNGSCSQRSPGVHIALANHRNPNSKAHPPPQ